MKTAIIHARVSDKKQDDNDISIPAQLERGRQKAEALGATVVAEFVEGAVSGWKGDRAKLIQAVEHCENNKVDYFLTWSSSRFARNRLTAIKYKLRLKASGTELIYQSMSVDLNSTEGQLLDNFMEVMDEYKSIQTSLDTKRSLVRNAEQGYWNGGKPCYGFRVTQADDNPRRRKLIINDDEIDTLKEIFQLKRDGHGARSITQLLNQQNKLNRGKRWNKTVVGQLLRNQTVTGHTVFNKKDGATGIKRPQKEWITVKSHVAAIPQALWELVQTTLDQDQANTTTGSPHSRHLFTGLLTCGVCQAPMHIESAKGRSKRYYYYVCRDAKQRKTHKLKRLNAEGIDRLLSKHIATHIITKQTLEGIAAKLESSCNDWSKEQMVRRNRLINKQNGLQRKINNIYEILEDLGKQAPNIKDLMQRIRDNSQEKDKIEQQISAINSEKEPVFQKNDKIIQQIRGFLTSVITDSEDPKRARVFLASFINGIEIREGEAVIEYDESKLITTPSGAVHSKDVWLPKRGLLGTATLTIPLTGGLHG